MHTTTLLNKPASLLAGLALVLTPLLLPVSAFGQGCMATRVSPPTLGGREESLGLKPGQMEFSMSYRFYEAERHFYDDNEEIVPANAPRVVRNVLDLSLTRGLTDRTSVTVSLPIQSGRFDRRPIPPYGASVDKATGIGDLAVTVRRWMLNSTTHPKYNIRLGVGLKLPTGKFDAETDRTYNTAPRTSPTATYVSGRGPADIAIQPGDGGFGIILGAEGFYMLGDKTSAYGELTYLVNPRGTNGMNNQWSGPGPYVPNNDTSVPDYFLGRAGLTFADPAGWKRGTALLGLRIEGQPVRDLVGSNAGFRRPGFSLSVEPGVAYSFSKINVFLTVPVTIFRQRWKSVDEQRAGRVNAVSAAFADYNIITGMSYRW
jgi:hypothetical protein